MADNDQSKTAHGDPAVASDLKTDNTPDETRTLDIGESGQFAPGGYYNQQEATRPERIDLDEQTSNIGDDKS
ncbi:MAG TPA: hypothetical protein VJT82_07585 [Pyrinomonadaceae bacterium]|nr:hypothetical protein [Pyrinomonadaceae bacterium]